MGQGLSDVPQNDIFLSYAREDRSEAEALVEHLEARGWSVWWDRTIPAGRSFDEVTEEEIDSARCVVVLWSKSSVTSRWVREEAAEGAHRGMLVPVQIEEVTRPFGFRRIQTADLTGWNGDPTSLSFERLVDDLVKILGPPPAEASEYAEHDAAAERRAAARDKRQPTGMSFRPTRVAVIGATGPTGIHLTRELVRRGRSVRAVSRRLKTLRELFAGEDVEVAVADALDADATDRAVDGCELVVDAIGLPPERMGDHPATARVIAEAARTAGARCLQISSYWSFFPHRDEVVDEGHPRKGAHRWFRLRREAEDEILAAGGAVVHLPDFFGPHVHTSTVQMALEAAAAGKPVPWLGRAETPRESAFVPDAMRIVADLAEREEAYGTDWGIPGSGPLTLRRLVEIAREHLGRPVRLRAVPPALARLLAWVHPELRQIRPMVPHYVCPVRYDTSKLRGLLGTVETTPFEEAVPETLDWIAGRAGH